MALESLLRRAKVDLDRTSVFIDANVLFLAHPDEIVRYKFHTTTGCVGEIEQWGRVQERRGQSQFLEALKGVDAQTFFDKVLYDSIFDNSLRYERARTAVSAMQDNRLVVDEKEVPEEVKGIGKLGAKRLAAEASKHMMPVWDSTADADWRKKQIGFTVEYAKVRYTECLEGAGLASSPSYYLVFKARIDNIERHVGYFFDEWCKNPQIAFVKAGYGIEENTVDQALVWTAQSFQPWKRDKKPGKGIVLVTKDIDVMELVADLGVYDQKLVRNVRVVPPP